MSTQDTTSNEQKPSAEAEKLALEAFYDSGEFETRSEFVEYIAPQIDELLARVRREARAEAFKRVIEGISAEITPKSKDCGKYQEALCDMVEFVKALAAKERAS